MIEKICVNCKHFIQEITGDADYWEEYVCNLTKCHIRHFSDTCISYEEAE